MKPHCLTRINLNYSQFSQTEKRIADYIINSPEDAVNKSIDQIAEELNVAISTVFRFSKRIGFKGFQAMKIALASEINEPYKEMVQEKINENDNEQAITEKIFNNNIRMFKETIQVMDFTSLRKAIDILLQGNLIQFFGSGGSNLVALDAHHKFIGSGFTTTAYGDAHLQLRSASQLTEKDVAVLISQSGTDREILQLLEIAKEKGAATIGITNLSNSPLSKKSDVVLYTVSNEMEEMEDSYSRILQFSLIDSLYVNVMSAKKAATKSATKGALGKLTAYLGKQH
jgi:RpiR family carbohydrate utilization transcriptional regulator